MKRIILALIAAPLAGCATTTPFFTASVVAPAAFRDFIGPKTGVVIVNPTPYWVGFVVDIESVPGCFGPGAVIVDNHRELFDVVDLAVAAMLFSDSACTRQVGLAGTVLTVRQGELVHWTVGGVCRLDGGWEPWGWGWQSPYPTPPAGKTVEMRLPRPNWRSETTVQVLNCSLLPGVVLLQTPGGFNERPIAPGEVRTYRVTPRYERAELSLTVRLEDGRGGHRGVWGPVDFWIDRNSSGPRAHQFLVRATEARTF